MAVKKRRATPPNGKTASTASAERLRRSDEEKMQIVRQIMSSGNQTAEIKKLGIYPNQFYDWKKRFADKLGLMGNGGAATAAVTPRRPAAAVNGARSLADEARAYLHGRTKLLEQLTTQREEIDELITQLEA